MELMVKEKNIKKVGARARHGLLCWLLAGWILILSARPVAADPLLSYGMTPIYAQDVENGTYPVEVMSDSPYFKMRDASLSVQDGEMTLRFAIHSLSYLYVFEGTAKEARHTEDESLFIPREEKDGESIFTIHVDALNKEIPCAAYSKGRKKWYGRNVVVYASSLPQDALKIDLPDYALIQDALEYYEEAGMTDLSKRAEEEETSDAGTEAETNEAVPVDLDDGEYSIECNMTGGSGRASISSPTILMVKDGRAYAHLLWSSTYYDYMLLGGEKFLNQTTDGGNSTFDIPITAFDEGITVIADTTAMGDPVEIEYVLTFYSDSIGDKGLVPQEAAKKVLIYAAVVIAVGGVLNYFVKRKRS